MCVSFVSFVKVFFHGIKLFINTFEKTPKCSEFKNFPVLETYDNM